MSAVGSLLVGLLNTFGQVMFPELAYFVIFGPMALLLAFRPLGLFGTGGMTMHAHAEALASCRYDWSRVR